MGGERGTPLERLLKRVDRDGPCWLFTGPLNEGGYGYVKVSKEAGTMLAHRLTYQEYVGPIPAGLEIDHLCRVRRCCNPKHLEAVTRKANILRGDTRPAANAKKTHCKRGHEFTPGNTYHERGKRPCRRCRTCRRERQAA